MEICDLDTSLSVHRQLNRPERAPSLSRLPWQKTWNIISIAHSNLSISSNTYLSSSVHGGKGVRVDSLAHSELVRDLEERRHAEDLGQIGADAGEHEVVEEDIALHLLGQVLDGSRV